MFRSAPRAPGRIGGTDCKSVVSATRYGTEREACGGGRCAVERIVAVLALAMLLNGERKDHSAIRETVFYRMILTHSVLAPLTSRFRPISSHLPCCSQNRNSPYRNPCSATLRRKITSV